ncbi:hypothetical protein TRIATDRAFT_88640 [Trichoderma atroviride IMI 206040]|uniref:BZIP domain-containing protein n=1 Tax=Hypocrea atroviridis (strain ATCC 20476 / IMI 206040) TaxID=452589 RepID=G9NTD5_HYPAI|nr:uncharacterized protein TRIATDRAFT_88640 [Trichoderma atroviride IMI 206040]EHK45978.1 hypothetical protein TRIATDRAFT_88640 [Trichoderma atroviride IMI 206040]
MEHVGATTTDAEKATEEQQVDQSDIEQALEQHRSSKSQRTKPQILKTSERRRIQNRAAQKTYREKQKRRLQALELYAKSHTTVSQDEAAFSTPTSAVGQDVAGMLGIDSPIMGLPELLQHHSLPIPDIGINDLVSCDPSLDAAPSSRLAGGPVPIYGEYIPSSNFQGNNVQNPSKPFQEEFFSASENRPTSIAGSNAITPESSLGSFNVQHSYGQAHGDGAPNGDSHNDGDADSLLAQFLLQDDVTLSRGLLRDIRKHKVTLRDVLRLGLQSLEGRPSSTAGSMRVTESSLQQRAYLQLPDLHTNTIRLTQMSFVAAVLHNASMLGITASEIFSHDTESYFCISRGASDASKHATQEPTLDHIKEHLKPTQNQLTHRHHPYIDTLPFRAFRDRLIAVIQAQPPIINMPELCHDLQSDGVICWGSSAGAGTGHSGAPWDIRSWEVRPWFLKKWWMLTEGAEGEMYQQARWWCEMRGEDMPAVW